MAPYTTDSATDFFPSSITTLIILFTIFDLKTGSPNKTLFFAGLPLIFYPP